MALQPRFWFLFAFLLMAPTVAAAQGTQLLREPTVSDQHVVFAYANDLWIVDRTGGDAQRLTSFPGTETDPHFSRDGQWIAFTGQYDGDTDAFVVPVEGGQPRRITHHPSSDNVRGWTPDGRVLYVEPAGRPAPQAADVDDRSRGWRDARAGDRAACLRG